VESASHRAHAVNEILDYCMRFIMVQIAEDLLAVLDGDHLVQRWKEEPVELIVAMPGGHPGNDLVEV
jgi:hypothetical protein